MSPADDKTKPEGKEGESKDADSQPASKEEGKEASGETPTANDGNTRKKRTADRQISKDDGSDDDEDGDRKGPFAKASEEVLKSRRIVKVKRPAGSSDDATPASSSNPFASASLLAGKSAEPVKAGDTSEKTDKSSTPSLFGTATGFAAFKAPTNAKSGFGFGNTSGTTSSWGFGAVAGDKSKTEDSTSTSKSLFGASASGKSTFSFSFQKPAASSDDNSNSGPVAALPEHVDLTTGEEDESIVHEGRCKSFKWVLEEENTQDKEDPQNTNAAAVSVKPSESFQNVDDKKKTASPEKAEKVDEKKDTDKVAESSSPSKPHRWQELGVGPMKILESRVKNVRKYRLVQRRESTPNGPAHKVILNIPVWKESQAELNQDSLYLSYTTIGPKGDRETYLFKFKETIHSFMFLQQLRDVAPLSKSCFGD